MQPPVITYTSYAVSVVQPCYVYLPLCLFSKFCGKVNANSARTLRETGRVFRSSYADLSGPLSCVASPWHWGAARRGHKTANHQLSSQLNALKRAALKRGGDLGIVSAFNSRVILTITHPPLRSSPASARLSARQPRVGAVLRRRRRGGPGVVNTENY